MLSKIAEKLWKLVAGLFSCIIALLRWFIEHWIFTGFMALMMFVLIEKVGTIIWSFAVWVLLVIIMFFGAYSAPGAILALMGADEKKGATTLQKWISFAVMLGFIVVGMYIAKWLDP